MKWVALAIWLGLAMGSPVGEKAETATHLDNDPETQPNSPSVAIGDFSALGGGSPWIRRAGCKSAYQFNFDESSWIFAREKCLAQNADLVSINDQEELDFILSRYPIDVRLRDRFLLIGLVKDPITGWTNWLDNTPVNHAVTPWKFGEPVEGQWASCVYLNVNGRILNRVTCDVRTLPILLTRYICERTPEEETYAVEADEAHDPINIFLFLRQLGKLTELGLNNKTDVQIFGKIDEKIDLEIAIRDPTEKEDIELKDMMD